MLAKADRIHDCIEETPFFAEVCGIRLPWLRRDGFSRTFILYP